MTQVVVLGSLNMDLVTTVDRLPQIGETIFAKRLDYFIGGKGANQAVAASRVGGNVTMLGKVGKDTFGERIIRHLQQETLEVAAIAAEDQQSTGIANVFKLPKDNCIMVVPGANACVDEAYVKQNAATIETATVLLMQLETPIEAVKKALSIAKAAGVTTILNPAPFSEEAKELLTEVEYITPNELEFQGLLPNDLKALSFEAAMLEFSTRFQTRLIVTRGSKGVSFVENGKVVTIPTRKAKVVDTTGAGDTLNGILATQLSKGETLETAIEFATIGATLSTTKFGAQTGMPTLNELEKFKNL